MTNQEMPIFTRTFDFLTWLLPATNNFPRAHRHSFTQRLLDAAFDLRERLEEANHRQGAARLERLRRADESLAKVRLYLRLAARWEWLSEGQYLSYPDRRRLKRRKGIHFRRRLRRLIAEYEAGQIPLDAVSASVLGWVNHVRYGNTIGLRKAVLSCPIGKSKE
jgi:hypothetical protein